MLDTSGTSGEEGITVELCAGIVDKDDLSPKQIAKEEVLEECGYDVALVGNSQHSSCVLC